MQIEPDMTLYRVRVNMVTGEPNYVWIQAKTRGLAERHIKYNLHPRATIGSIKPTNTPKEGETIHTVKNNEIHTETYEKNKQVV